MSRRGSPLGRCAFALALAVSAARADGPPPRDPPGARPSAGLEFGLGTLVPTLRSPLFHLAGRLGVAVPARTRPLTGIVAGGIGFDATFTAGSLSGGQYGYLLRIPLTLSFELVHAQTTDRRVAASWNHHYALGLGGELAVAANCEMGVCNYVPGNLYLNVFARVGASYSVGGRSAVGLFLTPHFTFAPPNVLATVSVSLGWIAF